MRIHDFGELVENVASPAEYHCMAGKNSDEVVQLFSSEPRTQRSGVSGCRDGRLLRCAACAAQTETAFRHC